MKSPLVILVALSMTAACAPADQTSPGFGNAVRQNIAAQVVNPDPTLADAAPEFDGERARDAVQRYRDDKVKRPVPMNTTTIIKGGSTK